VDQVDFDNQMKAAIAPQIGDAQRKTGRDCFKAFWRSSG
jgi:hypothetical protein